MIGEKDIRNIYKTTYEIAKLVGNGEYTREIGYKLHVLFGSSIQQTLREEHCSQPESKNLAMVIIQVNEQEYSKFRKLARRQEESEK